MNVVARHYAMGELLEKFLAFVSDFLLVYLNVALAKSDRLSFPNSRHEKEIMIN